MAVKNKMNKMNKFYAGIGSRNVPERVIEQIFQVSILLANRGYILRSGAADGCDASFEIGCDSVNGKKEIYLPWSGFNNHKSGIDSTTLKTYNEAQIIAKEFHPAWTYLKHYAKKFHTRNVYQVLGSSLKCPVEFVVCYTTDGNASGGTGQAMRIAQNMNIPIFNLFYEHDYEKLLA